MRNSVFLKALVISALSISIHAVASAEVITGIDISDSYLNLHAADKAGASVVPLVVFPGTSYPFNYYYSTMPVKWSLDLPASLQGKSLDITSATVSVWCSKENGGWNPSIPIELFQAGVTGANGFTTATWTESNFWFSAAGDQQDPYLIELGTGAHAEDNPNATPWAVATVDAAYNSSATLTDAVKITFQLDLTNPIIKNQLLTDISNGFAMYVVAGKFPANGPGGGVYPKIVTKEGVASSGNGTSQRAPSLTMEVLEASAVSDWNLY